MSMPLDAGLFEARVLISKLQKMGPNKRKVEPRFNFCRTSLIFTVTEFNYTLAQAVARARLPE